MIAPSSLLTPCGQNLNFWYYNCVVKMGYYKTMEIEKLKLNGKLHQHRSVKSRNIYKELPPHPPHKSVTDR